jgi:hypothetical protein
VFDKKSGHNLLNEAALAPSSTIDLVPAVH